MTIQVPNEMSGTEEWAKHYSDQLNTPLGDLKRIEAVIADIQPESDKPINGSEALGDHALAIMGRVTAEVMESTKRMRKALDEIDAVVIKSAGDVQETVRGHMRVSEHALRAHETVGKDIERLRELLIVPRT